MLQGPRVTVTQKEWDSSTLRERTNNDQKTVPHNLIT